MIGIAVLSLTLKGRLPEDNKPVPNDSVDLLLDSLETAEAIEFAEHEQVSKILSQPPARRITLQIEHDSTVKEQPAEQRELEISFHAHPKNEEHYYVSYNDSEQVYVAARSLLEAYTVSPEDNKDSALSDSAPDPQGG